MSLVTDLVKGRMSPQDFVVAVVADFKKDMAFFQALPFAGVVEGWALGLLEGQIARSLSPTFAALVIGEIRSELGLMP